MRTRTLVAAAVAIGSVLLAAGAADAKGGWAVTTLDSSTAAPVAGQPTDVGYTIRQHGVTPVSLDDTFIVVTAADGTSTRFAGHPDGPEGHHVATVTFPSAGTFAWSVEQGWFGPQDLGTIEIAGAGGSSAAAASSGDGSSTVLPAVLGLGAAVCAGVFALGLAGRRRRLAAPVPAA